MKETTNYNLKLPELTDYIDVSKFNHNFTIIDKELKKANMVEDATDISSGLVKISKVDGEIAPHTVPTLGKLQQSIQSESESKVAISDLTYEQDGLTYLAKLTIEDGQPTIITSEISK